MGNTKSSVIVIEYGHYLNRFKAQVTLGHGIEVQWNFPTVNVLDLHLQTKKCDKIRNLGYIDFDIFYRRCTIVEHEKVARDE